MAVDVKTCGLNTPEAVRAATEGGARFVGFVFFPPSPRAVSIETAATLVRLVPPRVIRVGLFVDAEDDLIARVLAAMPLDLLQLHGREPAARVAATRGHFGRPVMKAIPLETADDLTVVADYQDVADWLLFDARPPKDANLPGGNARPFDWSLLAGKRWARPWMLAGGLDAENVAKAVAVSGARTVDVSSGIEDTPGRKSPDKIAAFLRAAQCACPPPLLGGQAPS